MNAMVSEWMVNHLPSGWLEHVGKLVEVGRLERRDHVLGHRIDAGGSKVISGIGLRPVARLVERDHGRGGAEIVIGHLDCGIALLEGRKLRRPVGPSRAGIERNDHAFLAGGLVQSFLARIELGRIHDGLRMGEWRLTINAAVSDQLSRIFSSWLLLVGVAICGRGTAVLRQKLDDAGGMWIARNLAHLACLAQKRGTAHTGSRTGESFRESGRV